MFQAREPQESLWQSEFLITPRKAKLMRRSWAEVFRNEALVLIEEERFAPLYSPDMGRPNRAVQTVLGVLVLKEMFDLTDMEALEELEFNLLWHHALRLEMEEAHLAQKTLHSFRVRLMEHDGGRLAFSLNPPKEGVALASWSGKGVLLRFWDNGFATKTDPGKGAPNRCYHATTPTASVSPSTTAAWWPMPGCSFPPWPGISACPNSSGSASTWAMPRGGRTRATR